MNKWLVNKGLKGARQQQTLTSRQQDVKKEMALLPCVENM
jgi:hypothetical protein